MNCFRRICGYLLAVLGLSVPGLPGAVVINEIHYHPVERPAFDAEGVPLLDLSSDLHEFVELSNTGPTPVAL
ncbi:MAG TPA: hypothetical protein VNM37_07435, partial [Candidatus Dormibacteraeota bacterium]|nr:hypothetical protein [Candidatus Dormibacteraeota bacterium]